MPTEKIHSGLETQAPPLHCSLISSLYCRSFPVLFCSLIALLSLSAVYGDVVPAKQAITPSSTAPRTLLRRMNRSEYENTLRDLLRLPGLNVRDLLPDDGRADGYDKSGRGLEISSVQMAKYMEAADVALDAAIATRSEAPKVFQTRLYPPSQYDFSILLSNGDCVFLKDRKFDPLVPLISDKWHDHGEMYRNNLFKTPDSVGIFRHQDEAFGGRFSQFSPVHAGRYRIRISTWSFWWDKGEVKPAPRTGAIGLYYGGRLLGHFDAPSLTPTVHTLEVWLDPGEYITVNAASLWPLRVSEMQGRNAQFVGPGIGVDWLEVEGPIHDQWPPASHRQLFADLPLVPLQALDTDATGNKTTIRHPKRTEARQLARDGQNPPGPYQWVTVNPADPPKEAQRLLTAFLPQAFRRPVAPAEVSRYAEIVTRKRAEQYCFEEAMRTAYRIALCSPDFLFIRPELTAPTHKPLTTSTKPTPHATVTDKSAQNKKTPSPAPVQQTQQTNRIDDYALASRLSYFLWNSLPDDTLFTLARQNRLHDPATLHTQSERMLQDPRSERFVRDFLDQWLDLRLIDATSPDRTFYPEYGPYLRDSLRGEPVAFFRALLDSDLPASNCVDSDFLMLNQRLAEHYGIQTDNISGTAYRKVSRNAPTVRESHRGGFLTQAAVLKVTANGTTTSPVKRGAWVMRHILGQPPTPPPPNIPAIEPDVRGATTVREQLARHRANPGCAVCHDHIDPPGFALESFDVIGGYRDRFRATAGKDGSDATRTYLSFLTPDHKAPSYFHVGYRLGQPVDASGQTPTGRKFADCDAFKKLLLADERQLARNLVAQLTTYATGTPPLPADKPEIDRILNKTSATHYGVRSLIHALIESHLFQAR